MINNTKHGRVQLLNVVRIKYGYLHVDHSCLGFRCRIGDFHYICIFEIAQTLIDFPKAVGAL